MAAKKDKLLESAQKFLAKGQLDRAIREYEQIVALDPDDIRHRQRLAELLVRINQKDAAIAEYEVISKQYSSRHFYLKAIAVHKQIQKLDPDNIDVTLTLASLNEKQGLTGNALAEYNQAVSYYLGHHLLDEAIGVIERMLAADPDNLNTRLKCAETSYTARLHDKSFEEFARLALLLRKSGDESAFGRVCERVQSLFPEKQDFILDILEAQVGEGGAAGAAAYLLKVLDRDRSNLRGWKILADACLRTGDRANRKLALQNIIDLSPGEVSAMEELLRMFLDDGDIGGALDLLAGHFACFTDRGDFASLERFYLLLREKAPGDMRVLEGLRKVYDASGETNKLESVVCPIDVSSESADDGARVVVEEEFVWAMPEIRPAPEPVAIRPPPVSSAQPQNRALTWEEEIDLSMLEEEGISAFQNANDTMPEAASSMPNSPTEEAVAGNVYGETVVTGIDDIMESFPQPDIETGEALEETAPPYPAGPSTESAGFAEIEMELEGPAITDAGWQLESAGIQPVVEEAAAPPLPSGRKRSKYDLDGQFSEFKKVVDDQLDKDDTETHYNLGIAYKEMCLFDDAINEFQTASIAPLRKIDCLTLQGICYRDKGDYTKAEEIFRETLAMHDLTGGERVSLGYELAFLYEAMGRTEDAVGAYRQVWVESPGFRDVADKIARLHGTDDLPDNAADLELLELEAEEIE